MLLVLFVLKSFWHKGLKELFETGESAGVPPELKTRCKHALDALHVATALGQLNVGGYNPHPLHMEPVRHSIHVSGPWTITFEWVSPDAWRIDLEQYH